MPSTSLAADTTTSVATAEPPAVAAPDDDIFAAVTSHEKAIGGAPTLQRAQRLANRLVLVPGVRAVRLFGSVARGDATVESDVDLLVVTDGTVSEPLLTWHVPDAGLLDVGLSVYSNDVLLELTRSDPAFLQHLAHYSCHLAGDNQVGEELLQLAARPVDWVKVTLAFVQEARGVLDRLSEPGVFEGERETQKIIATRILVDRATMGCRPLLCTNERRSAVLAALYQARPETKPAMNVIQTDLLERTHVQCHQAAVRTILDALEAIALQRKSDRQQLPLWDAGQEPVHPQEPAPAQPFVFSFHALRKQPLSPQELQAQPIFGEPSPATPPQLFAYPDERYRSETRRDTAKRLAVQLHAAGAQAVLLVGSVARLEDDTLSNLDLLVFTDTQQARLATLAKFIPEAFLPGINITVLTDRSLASLLHANQGLAGLLAADAEVLAGDALTLTQLHPFASNPRDWEQVAQDTARHLLNVLPDAVANAGERDRALTAKLVADRAVMTCGEFLGSSRRRRERWQALANMHPDVHTAARKLAEDTPRINNSATSKQAAVDDAFVAAAFTVLRVLLTETRASARYVSERREARGRSDKEGLFAAVLGGRRGPLAVLQRRRTQKVSVPRPVRINISPYQ